MRGPELLKPRKRPRQQRSKFTVEQILEGAAHVFAERGYAETTTNHIADRAGVSIGSLYQYFPNKDALLVALMEQHMERTVAHLWEMLEEALPLNEPVGTLLRRFMEAMVDVHLEEPRLTRILLFNTLQHADFTEKLHQIEDGMLGAISQLLASRPDVTHSEPHRAAYFLVHIVENLVHEFVVHPPSSMDREAFVSELVRLLEGYLCAPCVQSPEAPHQP